MRAFIAFPAKSGRAKSIAFAIAAGLQENGFESDFFPVEIIKKKKPKTSSKEEKNRLEQIEIKPQVSDLSAYDLVVFGSPVFGLSPKRKISKAIEACIRQCQGIDGKDTAVFLSCFGIPGTALKKICALLQTRNVRLLDSLVLTYLLGLSKKQLEEAKEFGKQIKLSHQE